MKLNDVLNESALSVNFINKMEKSQEGNRILQRFKDTTAESLDDLKKQIREYLSKSEAPMIQKFDKKADEIVLEILSRIIRDVK